MNASPTLPSVPGPDAWRVAAGRAADRLGVAWRANPPLALTAFVTLALLVPFVVGVFVDPRVITAAPAWLKPAKFAASIAVYSLTLIWFLSFVRGRRRLTAVVSWGTAFALLLEIAIIGVQAGRGTTSHFNDDTPLDGALFSIMGAAIMVVWLLGLLVAVLLLRQRIQPPALAWGLRFGLVGALVGMAVAVPMVLPGQQAHAVGVLDGGRGLPIVGWSTEGGDLRAGHFVGLHAMHVLPLTAWLVTRFAPAWLGERRQAVLVGIVGCFWIALALLLTWQALRAQPLVAPDGLTLAALGGLVLAALAAGAITVGPAARRAS